MLAMEQDGKLQICAALSPLNNSRLLAWKAELATFKPVERDIFDLSWRKDVDPNFGRRYAGFPLLQAPNSSRRACA